MDLTIAAILAQDGLTTGAVYALLALALVLVFSVTRVIFIPQGEFVAYGALTLAALQRAKPVFPATCWLLLAMGFLCLLADLPTVWRVGVDSAATGRSRLRIRRLISLLLRCLCVPLLAVGLMGIGYDRHWPLPVQIALTLAIVVPLGPFLYRLAYRPLAEASTLLLLIVSVAVHFALQGLGLWMFGAEGSRAERFTEAQWSFSLGDIPLGTGVGALTVSGQSVLIGAVCAALALALYLWFGHTLSGKALRATAVNRLGARLIGIGTEQAGSRAFLLAALLGALSGILLAPLTTVYYDSGFLIGLKGFVGAILGGLASYPLAALGAVLVGFLESYASFWVSAYKEVLVFTLILPMLLWLSLRQPPRDDEGEP